MSKRRKRSGSITHKRAILTGARPPKGVRWRKVADLLEDLKVKHGPVKAIGLPIFQLLVKLQRENGWSGNAATQYCWDWWEKRGYSLTEHGLLEHIDGSEFGLWLDSLHKGWERVTETNTASRPQLTADKVESEADKAKRIGDEFRADMEELKVQRKQRAEEYARQRDAQDIWRLISKGEFPLGVAAFQAEMERRALERAARV